MMACVIHNRAMQGSYDDPVPVSAADADAIVKANTALGVRMPNLPSAAAAAWHQCNCSTKTLMHAAPMPHVCTGSSQACDIVNDSTNSQRAFAWALA